MKIKRCSGGSSILSLVFQVLHITCKCYVTEMPSTVHVLFESSISLLPLVVFMYLSYYNRQITCEEHLFHSIANNNG